MRLRWFGLATWMVIILFNSSVPGSPIPASGLVATLISKGGHILEYVVLAWLGWRALVDPPGGIGLAPRAAAVTLLVGGCAFAGLDELRQLFVAGRGSSPWDVLLDTTSVAACTAILLRDAQCQPPQPAADADQHIPAEDGQEDVHRQDLPVAVDVRQEDHHHQEVQPNEPVQHRRRG